MRVRTQRLFSSGFEDSWRRDRAGASVRADIYSDMLTKCSELWTRRMMRAVETLWGYMILYFYLLVKYSN